MRDNSPESLAVCLNHESVPGSAPSVIEHTFAGYFLGNRRSLFRPAFRLAGQARPW
jgi:hypothetical protein